MQLLESLLESWSSKYVGVVSRAPGAGDTEVREQVWQIIIIMTPTTPSDLLTFIHRYKKWVQQLV